MELMILLVVAIFSLVTGFFLGILFFRLDSPLAKVLRGSPSERETPEQNRETAPTAAPGQDPAEGQPQAEQERTARDAAPPISGAQLILEVWLENEQDLHFSSFGRTYRRDQLPEPLLKILQMERIEKMPPPQPTSTPPVEPGTFPSLEEEPPQKKEVKLLSVIQEIDKILQEKLMGSPLNNKGIQLMENQQQEIRIWVGLQSYDRVEDVPDPDVRKLILESVEEWENKNE